MAENHPSRRVSEVMLAGFYENLAKRPKQDRRLHIPLKILQLKMMTDVNSGQEPGLGNFSKEEFS